MFIMGNALMDFLYLLLFFKSRYYIIHCLGGVGADNAKLFALDTLKTDSPPFMQCCQLALRFDRYNKSSMYTFLY